MDYKLCSAGKQEKTTHLLMCHPCRTKMKRNAAKIFGLPLQSIDTISKLEGPITYPDVQPDLPAEVSVWSGRVMCRSEFEETQEEHQNILLFIFLSRLPSEVLYEYKIEE